MDNVVLEETPVEDTPVEETPVEDTPVTCTEELSLQPTAHSTSDSVMDVSV